MMIAKVVGTITSNKKSDDIDGSRYLLVNQCNQNIDLSGNYFVVLDIIGATVGEIVMIAQGSAARQTHISNNKPIDAILIGIIDLIDVNNKFVYQK
jgi:carbon dioxide concentrating mechanism protein CcmL